MTKPCPHCGQIATKFHPYLVSMDLFEKNDEGVWVQVLERCPYCNKYWRIDNE